MALGAQLTLCSLFCGSRSSGNGRGLRLCKPEQMQLQLHRFVLDVPLMNQY